MKTFPYKPLLLAALASGLMLAGCSNNDKTSQEMPSMSSPALKEDKTGKSSQSTDTSSTEEEKDDDLLLPDLQAAKGDDIDLSKASSNVLIEKGGSYTLSGSTQKSVVVDAGDEEVTLVLDGVSISAKTLPAIYVRNAKALNLEAKGENSLESQSHEQADALNAALYVRTGLNLKGTGSLSVHDAEGHAIKAKDDMQSESLALSLDGAQDGIHASDSLHVVSGSYTIKAGDEGIQTNQNLLIKDGTFTIESAGDGLRAEDLVEIDNGTFDITTENEGIESKNSLLIKNGKYTIDAADDGLNAASSLTIENGTLDIVSGGNDGIDSNGDLIISGGSISAVGLSPAEGAFDTDNTPFEINGGTVIGLSSSASLPSSTKQNVILLNADPAFSKLELKQDGKTLLSWTNTSQESSARSSQAVLMLSCKDLQAGKDAELYLDDELAETISVEEGITKVGNIQTGPGGMGQRGGMGPGGMNGAPDFEGEMPEGMTPPAFEEGERPEKPDFENGEFPENGTNKRQPNRRRSQNTQNSESESV